MPIRFLATLRKKQIMIRLDNLSSSQGEANLSKEVLSFIRSTILRSSIWEMPTIYLKNFLEEKILFQAFLKTMMTSSEIGISLILVILEGVKRGNPAAGINKAVLVVLGRDRNLKVGFNQIALAVEVVWAEQVIYFSKVVSGEWVGENQLASRLWLKMEYRKQ